MNRSDVIINARELLGLSQARLAASIGVSAKAVQSYEQGWRPVPNRFFSQLFVLLTDVRKQISEQYPCWYTKNCELRDCGIHQTGSGCFCWMLAADHCAMMNSDEHDEKADFMSCPVLAKLLICEK